MWRLILTTTCSRCTRQQGRAIGGTMRRPLVITLTSIAVLSLWGAPVFLDAQTSRGAIAGTVKDATGALLPGVTVEASSPALIEKVRTVVTDGTGEYKIVELPPGTYTVTFT